MTRLIIPALVALLISGPAWAGSQEIGDCEVLIKKKLKFPGSFKREYVISDTEGLRWDEKKNTLEDNDLIWIVEIEFTAKTKNNSVQRRIGFCGLEYNEGSLFKSKKLNWSKSKATIKYE